MLATNRKQRLKTLKAQIRNAWEQWVQTGFALKEIKEDELYKEDGYERFDSWVKKEIQGQLAVDIQAGQAQRLITAAAIRPKIGNAFQLLGRNDSDVVRPTVVLEFARLAPEKSEKGSPRDVDSLRKQDVQRVAKRAVAIAKEQDKPVTAKIVRQTVDTFSSSHSF